MGGSGSGKTTLARIASGRIAAPSGIIERSSSLSAPADCVYVDQDAWNSVFPYRTVEQNLHWTLAHLGWKPDEAFQTLGAAFVRIRSRTQEGSLPA